MRQAVALAPRMAQRPITNLGSMLARVEPTRNLPEANYRNRHWRSIPQFAAGHHYLGLVLCGLRSARRSSRCNSKRGPAHSSQRIPIFGNQLGVANANTRADWKAAKNGLSKCSRNERKQCRGGTANLAKRLATVWPHGRGGDRIPAGDSVCGPTMADAYSNLGVALGKQGRLDEAEQCFSAKRRALQPFFPGVYNNLGNLLREMGTAFASRSDACRLAIGTTAGIIPPGAQQSALRP